MVRVLSAMSGGVDSAVATARLIDAGHEVTGVHLALSRTALAQQIGARGWCSLADSNDARRVADKLGIPFYVWDFSERFADEVITDFLDEYSQGRTPNPCLRCNEKIKFAALLERGRALGFDAVATGHYAQVKKVNDHYELWRAADSAKDQSYVLGVLDQDQLAHSLFPLGGSVKSDVRAEAAELGFSVANKPDSVDICFIPTGDTAGFLTEKLGPKPGEIVDTAGNTIGHHDGTYRFTIGQRKGLNLGVPAPDGKSRYVVGIDPNQSKVVVGSRAELGVRCFEGIRPKWTQGPVREAWHGLVQVRAHGRPVEAQIDFDGENVIVKLDEDLTALAPGQYAVLYDGDRVVGSTIVANTNSVAEV